MFKVFSKTNIKENMIYVESGTDTKHETQIFQISINIVFELIYYADNCS
jgi:hypothetical protein